MGEPFCTLVRIWGKVHWHSQMIHILVTMRTRFRITLWVQFTTLTDCLGVRSAGLSVGLTGSEVHAIVSQSSEFIALVFLRLLNIRPFEQWRCARHVETHG